MVLGLVVTRLVIHGLGGFDQLPGEVLCKTNVEADHRHSGIVRRFDLLDAIVNLSSRPVGASQASRRAAAEETDHNTDESNQRKVKCAVVAKAVGTVPHPLHDSTNLFRIVSRGKALRHVDRPRLRSFNCCKHFLKEAMAKQFSFSNHTFEKMESLGLLPADVGPFLMPPDCSSEVDPLPLRTARKCVL